MNKEKITLKNIIDAFNLRVICGTDILEREVAAGYAGDLLSDVMANAKKGDIWLTRQAHPNIVAVAVLRMLSGVIIINNREPEEETVTKAIKEKLPLMTSELPAFELAGRLYEYGIRGLHTK
jgi:serine kinase of HPr protein (carbohydrate metabolism regulator)